MGVMRNLAALSVIVLAGGSNAFSQASEHPQVIQDGVKYNIHFSGEQQKWSRSCITGYYLTYPIYGWCPAPLDFDLSFGFIGSRSESRDVILSGVIDGESVDGVTGTWSPRDTEFHSYFTLTTSTMTFEFVETSGMVFFHGRVKNFDVGEPSPTSRRCSFQVTSSSIDTVLTSGEGDSIQEIASSQLPYPTSDKRAYVFPDGLWCPIRI